ncbi:Prosaposin, partial [Mucuna pruriens]
MKCEAHNSLDGALHTEALLKFKETEIVVQVSPTNASEDGITNHHSLPHPTRHSKRITTTLLLLSVLDDIIVQPDSGSGSGTMEGRIGLLFLVVLGAAWACDARELANSELSKKPDLCVLCEEYTTKALDYLNENKTQQEIIEILHSSCHQLLSFKQKCIAMVDYYAPLFFLEITTIQPGEFCHKVNLCQHNVYVSLKDQEDTCEFCKDTVSTLLEKLEDSDIKLIETLLKVCNSVEKYADKCKKMVFEYGPLILENAKKFLEKTDICTAIHACKSSTVAGQQAFLSDS